MSSVAAAKYKVYDFAKDFDLSNNEVMDLLEKYSERPKSHMVALEPKQLDVLFEVVTRDQAGKGFDRYCELLNAPKAKPAPAKPAPAPAQKPAARPAANRPQPASKPAPSKPAAQAPKPASAPAQKPAARPAAAAAPAKGPHVPTPGATQTISGPPAPRKKTGQRVERGTVEKRYVDTRTVTVDLSKYDQKLEDLAPEKARDLGRQFQKFKKQPSQRRTRGRKETEAEKIKRLEAERAKRPQLSVVLPEEIVVFDLAAKLHATNAQIIKKLMELGIMAAANQTIDYDAAALVAEEFGAKVSKEVVVTIEEKLIDESEDKDENLQPRNPVVVVMGHVDHGKTSLLDAIRHTSVTSGEAGGITQHIGAYKVKVHGQDITFLDTPGHEAFTAMRARGAMVTDIAILVVAADDGIMPQTVEAINHAKAAGVAIIVAINKMDKPGANPDKVKQALTEYDLVPEEWGGDVICVPVSAVKHEGIEELLESVLLVAEMRDLKANPDRAARGTVIEARLDKGRGPVATVLVQNGTLRTGDTIIAGTAVGRVRVMNDDRGQSVKSAGPSDPVEIIGLDEVPIGGDVFHAVADERMARELVAQRKFTEKEEKFSAGKTVSLDDLFAQIEAGAVKDFNIIVKADVQGSAEAVKQSLEKLSNDEVRVRVIHAAVGGINESDVNLALASGAVIVGFNVRPDAPARQSAARNKIDIRTYRVIYECIEEIEAALKGLLAPKVREKVTGHAQIRQVIRISGVGAIGGCYVLDGQIQRGSKARLLRDNVVIFEGGLASLRRFKDDVKEVNEGYECGIGLEKFNDIKEGDVIEAYIMEEYKA